MEVRSHTNSLYNSMSYVFKDVLIDSGDVWDGFNNVSVVLLTHAHFDHIYGLNELLSISPQAKVYTNAAGKEMLLNARKNLSFYHETPFVFQYPEQIVLVGDGEEVSLGNGLKVKAIFTPGHNLSCISWIIGDAIFSGDSYISGIKTVTNLPNGNKQQAIESEHLIKELLIGKTIYPGHS